MSASAAAAAAATHLQSPPAARLLLAATPLLGLLLLGYLLMWRGWRKQALLHELPPLIPLAHAGPVQDASLLLPAASARYFGTTRSGHWLDRVVARGLGARSTAELRLDRDGLDVVRYAGGFRVPARALRGARRESGIAGKVVPPAGILVVTWQHGDYLLDSGFRLVHRPADDRSVADAHDTWIRALASIGNEHST